MQESLTDDMRQRYFFSGNAPTPIPKQAYQAAGLGFFTGSTAVATAAEWAKSKSYVHFSLLVALSVGVIATAIHYAAASKKADNNKLGELLTDFYLPILSSLLLGTVFAACVMPFVPHSSLHHK